MSAHNQISVWSIRSCTLLQPKLHTPHWVSVLSHDGVETFRCTPASSIPDAVDVQIEDAAVNTRGMLAVSVFAMSATAQRSNAVVIYDMNTRSKEAVRVVRIFAISVDYLAIDEQNNIWILGPDMQTRDEGHNYGCIHKLSPRGNS